MSEDRIDKFTEQGSWRFDEEVTEAFDDMLRRSIPSYEAMREAVFRIGSKFILYDGAILDLGCSRGESLARFVERFAGPRDGSGLHKVIGLDSSEPMVAAARERFAGMISRGFVSIELVDLRTKFPAVRPSLTLSVLTLQFIPIEYRLGVLRKVWEATMPGGALILVEKVTGEGAAVDRVFLDQYLELKADHGYSREEILRKKLALEGVLVPLTASWNVELLRLAGFAEVDCFWRWLNFGGWLAVKRAP